MDRSPSQRIADSHPPMPSTYPSTSAFPLPSAAPTTKFPFPDPFQLNKDPFLTRALDRAEGYGSAGRAWPSTAGHNMPNGQAPPQNRPPPLANGTAPMSLPYDPSRRRSLGASGSPPQSAPLESLPHPSPFQSRHMPPPSPPQLPTSASSLPGSAPLGPPTAAPFTGVRDLASYSSNRSSAGMSISSILGGNSEEKRTHGSPPSATTKPMAPSSPGRARSSSMREPLSRPIGDGAPARTVITEQPRPASAVFSHDRTASEPRRERLFASPRFREDASSQYRAFQRLDQDVRHEPNGHEPSRRAGSQPAGPLPPRNDRDPLQVDPLRDGRYGAFRPFGEASAPPQQPAAPRQEGDPHSNGQRPASTHAEQARYSSPQEYPPHGVLRFQAGTFGAQARGEPPSSLFRPAYQPPQDAMRESIEPRAFPDIRRDVPRSSPPVSEFPPFDRNRNAFGDRPVGIEEHQRADVGPREPQRKESDPYYHRAVFNISPEAHRKGRNSPLPQAIQGAQPRHIGPGGDNPNVKMEFGRMFSGLGSGVGTSTPTGGHANGTATPTRMTPIRQVEAGDLVHTAVAEIEARRSAKLDGRAGRKNGRRTRDEEDRVNGRDTPEQERGAKRARTAHNAHHHHVHPHHHHHHHPVETPPTSGFTPIRFQPNQPPQPSTLVNAPTHHHHHHHGAVAHAHPVHHHHHVPRPALPPAPPPRKPTTTITSQKVLDGIAKKPRKHLGSQLYTLDFSIPPGASIHIDSRTRFSGKSEPIPLFEGKENCTFTVRVPRQYLTISNTPGYLEEICKHRQLWGTEIYTDDSDVIATAVHSGWLKGDFGDFNDDLREVCDNDSEREDGKEEEVPTTLSTRPRKPVRVPADHDAHITVVLLPPLDHYASTNQHHIWSREWGSRHDGMSFMIERIDFVDEAPASRARARGAKARKERIAAEEASRRQDAAAGLLMFSKNEAPPAAVAAV